MQSSWEPNLSPARSAAVEIRKADKISLESEFRSSGPDVFPLRTKRCLRAQSRGSQVIRAFRGTEVVPGPCGWILSSHSWKVRISRRIQNLRLLN